jgi:dephospho-CoA kinase
MVAAVTEGGQRFVVGLTGGIGSGKSVVADAFAKRGADITDTDRLAHALSARGEAGHAAILAAFGDTVCRPDGTIDRERLRDLVFADAGARARLEAILHPLIAAAALAEIAAWRAVYGIVVVPLLFERGGLASIVARTLVVDCSEEQQVRRVAARSGLAPKAVRAIMATQLSRPERLARADDVIDNSGPLEAIAPQVDALDRRYRQLASVARAPGR